MAIRFKVANTAVRSVGAVMLRKVVGELRLSMLRTSLSPSLRTKEKGEISVSEIMTKRYSEECWAFDLGTEIEQEILVLDVRRGEARAGKS